MALDPASKELHPWYRGRQRVLGAELDRLDLPPHPRILDAGCGAGGVLADLARRGDACGVDVDEHALAAARARGLPVKSARASALPFDDASFDLVCCLDVLEHVEDDGAVLRELRRVTRPHGTLLVTVPAHPALWSGHDRAAGHVRRYRQRALLTAAQAAGWRAHRATHFNTLLLPVAALMRWTDRRGGRSHLERGPVRARGALAGALRLEARLLARGARLPVGLSLLAVLRSA